MPILVAGYTTAAQVAQSLDEPCGLYPSEKVELDESYGVGAGSGADGAARPIELVFTD